MIEPDNQVMQPLVVIGASAGGLKALQVILNELLGQVRVPVVVCKHLAAGDEEGVCNILRSILPDKVELASDKQNIKPGHIYIAPGNYHLQVEKRGWLSLSTDERVCYCRPAIDVLFETAAIAYQSDLVAIVLTGANRDGTVGVQWVSKAGGTVIVQSPDSAEVKLMPEAAIATGCADHIMELTEIARYLKQL